MNKLTDTLIRKKVTLFTKDKRNSPDGRYQSWNYCYNYFHTKNRNNLEQAALVLGFYLASWGMYRGSSFLLKEYSFTVHIKTVEILNKYNHLFQQTYIENFNDLEKLINELKKYYSTLNKKVTDTLISKIIMGTLGLIPAYDNFVKLELAQLKIPQRLTPKSYKQLVTLYNTHKNTIDSIIDEHKKENYTPMKILDIVFWELGKDIKEEKNKRLSH